MLFNVTSNATSYFDSNDSEHWTSHRTNISEPQSCYDFSLEFKVETESKLNDFVDETFRETVLIVKYKNSECSTTFDLHEKPFANIFIVILNPLKFDLSSESLTTTITHTWNEKIASLFQTNFLKIMNDFVKILKM